VGMFFKNRKKNTIDKTVSNVNNVVINKDGIVSLNLKSKSVQKKVLLEINKLKEFESELTPS
jgi:hypothetical protein